MHLTNLFIPILKNNPSEAKIKSHQLMLRTGMIKQASAGLSLSIGINDLVKYMLSDYIS